MAIKEIFTVEEANVFLEEGLLWFAYKDGTRWNISGKGHEWAPLSSTLPDWSARDFVHYRCGIMLEE